MGKSIVQARCSSMPAQALAASAAGRASVQHSPSALPLPHPSTDLSLACRLSRAGEMHTSCSISDTSQLLFYS